MRGALMYGPGNVWPYRGIGIEGLSWPTPMGHEYAVGTQVTAPRKLEPTPSLRMCSSP